MHAGTMLAEIVVTRPDLVLFGTVCCRTTEASIVGISRRDFMDTLLVAFKVVVGAESIFSQTASFFTEERLGVSKLMFPGQTWSVRASVKYITSDEPVLGQIL